ncbi:MAG: crossover junction endodeoxyribonuclease [Candidatus Thiodiazotropha lotti]|nr:crossover junction endodeoxyribonuclease [Candidatus Thiodiazotropha lotti]
MKIGIDPGISGAIAVLSADDEVIGIYDMPIMRASKTKNQVNAAELANIIIDVIGDKPMGVTAIIEKVSAMPGQGVSSMFNFGKGAGVIEGVLAALRVPVEFVTPQKWKKAAGLIGKDKDMSRTKAIQLYPDAPLARKKDIGRADAILIARYGT